MTLYGPSWISTSIDSSIPIPLIDSSIHSSLAKIIYSKLQLEYSTCMFFRFPHNHKGKRLHLFDLWPLPWSFGKYHFAHLILKEKTQQYIISFKKINFLKELKSSGYYSNLLKNEAFVENFSFEEQGHNFFHHILTCFRRNQWHNHLDTACFWIL